jgi:GH15 family glucan-1,4-alpha-glucosidase
VRSPLPIEDYALLGDTQTAALVGRDGSVDWLCMPRFDSAACFAALLGDERNGRWLIAPVGEPTAETRRYVAGTLVLETHFKTDEGEVRVTDFMPPRETAPDIVRIVEGIRGRVNMRMQLVIRFEYGSVVPWVRRIGDTIVAIAGPDALYLRTPVATRGEDLTTVAEFPVAEEEVVPFVLTWHPSHLPPPRVVDPVRALEDTVSYWQQWSDRNTYEGEWEEAVNVSLMTLKALTYAPTGGIVAASTTSLPEQLGGVRNWDYRYCWVRDATFTLMALMSAGFRDEAMAWRDWLTRAVAGRPEEMQIMYGPAGERRLPEFELGWLPGYQGASPVRIGNAAVDQFQLDVYGEVMDALHIARCADIGPDDAAWALQRKVMEALERVWEQADDGIWEVRGPRRHFVHSKVMAWVAADRAVKAVERFGLHGDADRWRALAGDIRDEVLEKGYDSERRTFTQSYGSRELDASLLMIPLVGFLPPDDERVIGTVEAIQRELVQDGFVLRYPTGETDDGLPPGEGAFLACTFWLADNLALIGRMDEARELFERLLSLRNDLGLLAEEYDPDAGRLVGNFPQAFSHVGLVNTAHNLSETARGVAERRATEGAQVG